MGHTRIGVIVIAFLCLFTIGVVCPVLDQPRRDEKALVGIVLDSISIIKNLNEGHKKEIDKLNSEINSVKKVDKRWRRAFAIYQFYVDCGMIYEYAWINPQFLYDFLLYGDRYRSLAPDYDYDTLDPEGLYCLWTSREGNFNPSRFFIYENKNKKKGKDRFIMQMNSVHYDEKDPKKNLWRRVEVLYPHLKSQSDWSVEKNVAVWYLWLGEQAKRKNPDTCWKIYCRSRQECKDLYSRVVAVK